MLEIFEKVRLQRSRITEEGVVIVFENVTVSASIKTLILSGVSANISQSNMGDLHIHVRNHLSADHLELKPWININNSTFGHLDLQSNTEAMIKDTAIDALLKPRSTLIVSKASRVTIEDCHFSGFVNENESAVIHATDSTALTIANSVFDNNHGLYGIVLAAEKCFVNVLDTVFSNNIAYQFRYSALTIMMGVTMTMNNSVFESNVASKGGVIWAENGCEVNTFSCVFMANEAKNGGAVFVNSGSTVLMRNGTMAKNRAQFIPFILKKISVTKAFSGSLFQQFYADGLTYDVDLVPAGGAIYVQRSAANIETSHFEENTAVGGGAMFVRRHSTLFVADSEFIKNEALLYGGAIMLSRYTNGTVYNCRIVENNAHDCGGGLGGRDHTMYKVQGTTFKENIAPSGGAACAFLTGSFFSSNCSFTKNIGHRNAGAILLAKEIKSEISSCYFEENSAPAGGAISISGETQCTINDSFFFKNEASQTDGSAVSFSKGINLKLCGCHFENNKALFGAGTVRGCFKAALHIENCTFNDNYARRSAAVEISQNSTVYITNGLFINNNASLSAGAFGVTQDVKCTVVQSGFHGNRAASAGAAHLVDMVDAYFVNVTFQENRAVKSVGGAMDISFFVSAQLKNCEFYSNFAQVFGGGMKSGISVNVHVESSIFTGNEALYSGGAFHIYENATFQVRVQQFIDIFCAINYWWIFHTDQHL